MNNSIQVFSSNEFSVRTTRDDDGNIWFVAKDIMKCLDYSNASTPAQVMQSVPDIWKGIKRIDTVERGMQDMLCLTEQGVYFFLGRSDKPKALPYQMWIAGDVVPSIRETGSYTINQNVTAIPQGIINEGAAIFERAGLKGNQLVLALDKLFKSYTGRSALQSADIHLVSHSQKQLLTPTDIGNQFGVSARKVNDILAGAGYQHKIAGKWEAIGDGANYSVMQDTNKRHSDGTPVCQLKWVSSILPVFEGLLNLDEESYS